MPADVAETDTYRRISREGPVHMNTFGSFVLMTILVQSIHSPAERPEGLERNSKSVVRTFRYDRALVCLGCFYWNRGHMKERCPKVERVLYMWSATQV